MGSKLTVLAAVIACAGTASADPAGDLLKQGIDQYKAGKYAEAVTALGKSYDISKKPETLFALAQAERLEGDCATATAHYRQVVEQVSDLNVAKLVEQNLALCEKIEKKHEPTPPKPEPEPKAAPPPPPQIITKTVVRDVPHTDVLAASAFAAGTLGIGAAGGLYLAASASRNAAGKARTLDDHNTLLDRADTDTKAMFVAGGLGVALIAVSVYRWTRGEDPPKTDVALTPSAGGGTLWVTSRW